MNRPSFIAVVGVVFSICLAGCGGGGGGSNNPAPSTTANQLPVVVEQFQGVTGFATINEPYVTVTVCDASGNCQNIDHVVVDTASYGLRIPASVLTVKLPQESVPAGTINAGSQVGECANFLDGYMWGSVRIATVKMSGEIARNIPIQVTDDPAFAAVPNSCSGTGIDVGTVNGIGGNGIIGLGLFNQDGQNYYACTGTICAGIPLPPPNQVGNPVAAFPQDNNGVILQMQAIPASGQATASGTLTFGLGTQADNSLSGYSILQADTSGYITVSLDGQTFAQSFIDSGSNFHYLDLTGVPTTMIGGSPYYTPSSTLTYQTTLNANAGMVSSLTTPLSVANAQSLNAPFNAFNDIAAPGIPNMADLGMPFFYGRSVAFGISGAASSLGANPFYGIR